MADDTNGNDETVKTRMRAGFFSELLTRSGTFTLERTDTMLTIGKLKLRGKTDDLPQYVQLPIVLGEQ
jgi:hypothetical protein